MPNASIYRALSTPGGTFGMFFVGGAPVCVTCELPWKNNQHDVSCIPSGTYNCIRHVSEKFPSGDTWEVTSVPDRQGILIHAGNDTVDLQGCIAPGEIFGTVEGVAAVLQSRNALANLNTLLPDEFVLTIHAPADFPFNVT
ncbi:MAG TPA: DUF5675 family protein [Bryobacteraceae bacterium]|nr:DUF5675 family protein [Bryobacteraceae bacterium]